MLLSHNKSLILESSSDLSKTTVQFPLSACVVMISLFDQFRKACFSSLLRIEGTFFDEFRTLTILHKSW